MRHRLLLGIAVAILSLLGIHAALVISAPSMHPLRTDPLAPDASSALLDAHVDAARLYAPWIYHETSAILGRQDIPAAMDFDGDLLGSNHWESFPRFELIPTVYYTYAETQTHVFLTYHLFHPRDWNRFTLGVQDTHEGDGESVQMVVDKANASVILLTTQAHYDAWSYAPIAGPIHSGAETLRADFEIFTGHPIVYVESEGHGLFGSRDPRAANRLARIGEPVVSYRVAGENDTIAEPVHPWNETVPYRLVSLPAFLGNSTLHPTLFAGYEGDVPRYHLGDRYSGPLGSSRGISPFALGYSRSDEAFSDLFFDPARTYKERLSIEGAWSTEYVVRPFGISA